MPQIAQQDYLVIPIANPSLLTTAEKAEIKKHIANNTIWDCLITWKSGDYTMTGRVLGVCPEDGDLMVSDPYNTEAINLDFN